MKKYRNYNNFDFGEKFRRSMDFYTVMYSVKRYAETYSNLYCSSKYLGRMDVEKAKEYCEKHFHNKTYTLIHTCINEKGVVSSEIIV